MNKNIYLLLLLVMMCFVVSCKKDAQQTIKQQSQTASLGNGVTSFSINGQLLPATIDTEKNLITVVVPHTVDMKNLTINFSLANQVTATIKNVVVSSGSTVDFTKLVYFTITSADKKRSSSFEVSAQTDLFFEGLTGNVIAEKNLNRDYNFYYDQFDGSTWSSVNCGPTAATMAIKWHDSTFNKTPGDARQVYEPGGGDWSTRNISDYLATYGLNMVQDTSIHNLDSLIKANIDIGHPLILCLDTYYISVDNLTYHHVNKYYPSTLPGTGHFLFVKGYEQMQNAFYLLVDDPWSQNLQYYPSIIPNEPFGEDRYYLDRDIKTALLAWDPEVYIIAPTGEQIITSVKSKNKLIRLAFGR